MKASNESGYRPFEGWLALVLMTASMRPTMRRTLFFCAFQDDEVPEDGIGAKGAAAAPAPSIEFTEITEVLRAPAVLLRNLRERGDFQQSPEGGPGGLLF